MVAFEAAAQVLHRRLGAFEELCESAAVEHQQTADIIALAVLPRLSYDRGDVGLPARFGEVTNV